MGEQSSLPAVTASDDDSVAADKLKGAAKIGQYIGETPDAPYKLFEAGRLPGCWKDGKFIYGSKRAIRRNYDLRARSGK